MFSETATHNILNALFGKTQYVNLAPNCYLGLSATDPSLVVKEPSGNGYSRKFIGGYQTPGSQYMGTPANGLIANSQEIHFDEATGSWLVNVENEDKPLVWFCVYSSATGGTPLAWGKLGETIEGVWQEKPLSPVANTVVVIKAGDLRISLT